MKFGKHHIMYTPKVPWYPRVPKGNGGLVHGLTGEWGALWPFTNAAYGTNKTSRWMWMKCLEFLWLTTLRAALHYGGEVHQSVKSFSRRHGYLRQGMVCWRRWKHNKIFYSSWSSLEIKFLVWGFGVAQETWPPENSPSTLASMSFFHPCIMFSPKGLLIVV